MLRDGLAFLSTVRQMVLFVLRRGTVFNLMRHWRYIRHCGN